jgi:hypothetical protein
MDEKYGACVTLPAGVKSSDGSGEQGSVKNNIPNAKTNAVGKDMDFCGGKMSGMAYTHGRKSYQ